MFQAHLGEVSALAAAICWTVIAVCFESASKKVGSLAVNFIRLDRSFGISLRINFQQAWNGLLLL